MSSLSIKSLSLAVLILAANTAQANITVYTNESAYLAAVGTTGIDSFDDLPIAPLAAPLTRAAGAYGYRAEVAYVSPVFYGAGNGNDHWLSSDNRTDTITLTGFASNVRGVGGFFFGTNIAGDFTASRGITLTAIDQRGKIVSYDLLAPTTASFLGFVSDEAFKQVSFKSDLQAGVWGTANDLHLSIAAVPEPETYGMLLAGLGMLAFLARRRKA